MSNVINFPSTSAKSDADKIKELREGLSSHGFSSEAIEAAISSVMPLFHESNSRIKQNVRVNFTSTLNDEQVEDLRSQLSSELQQHHYEVSDFIQKLIVKIALLEARAVDV